MRLRRRQRPAACAHAALLAALLLPACRSSSDKAPVEPSSDVASAADKADAAPEKTPEKSPSTSPKSPQDSVAKVDCKTKPDTSCCEALTPTCNECRAKAAKALDAWKSACDKPAPRPAECGEKLPSVACCPEASAACNACRSEALNKLLERRAKCGEAPTP